MNDTQVVAAGVKLRGVQIFNAKVEVDGTRFGARDINLNAVDAQRRVVTNTAGLPALGDKC